MNGEIIIDCYHTREFRTFCRLSLYYWILLHFSILLIFYLYFHSGLHSNAFDWFYVNVLRFTHMWNALPWTHHFNNNEDLTPLRFIEVPVPSCHVFVLWILILPLSMNLLFSHCSDNAVCFTCIIYTSLL